MNSTIFIARAIQLVNLAISSLSNAIPRGSSSILATTMRDKTGENSVSLSLVRPTSGLNQLRLKLVESISRERSHEPSLYSRREMLDKINKSKRRHSADRSPRTLRTSESEKMRHRPRATQKCPSRYRDSRFPFD